MVNSPFAPARENSPPRGSLFPRPHPLQEPVPAEAGARLLAPSPGPYSRAPRDGTQRTNSSRAAVGWRRTEALGRTLHAIAESAARLEVGGAFVGSATGRARHREPAHPPPTPAATGRRNPGPAPDRSPRRGPRSSPGHRPGARPGHAVRICAPPLRHSSAALNSATLLHLLHTARPELRARVGRVVRAHHS